MISIREELGKKVDHKTLEAAIKKAAKETGLTMKDKPDVSENGECTCTKFHFRRFFLPAIEVVTYNHGGPIDFFRIYADGITSKKTVEAYVERVHNYLKKS